MNKKIALLFTATLMASPVALAITQAECQANWKMSNRVGPTVTLTKEQMLAMNAACPATTTLQSQPTSPTSTTTLQSPPTSRPTTTTLQPPTSTTLQSQPTTALQSQPTTTLQSRPTTTLQSPPTSTLQSPTKPAMPQLTSCQSAWRTKAGIALTATLDPKQALAQQAACPG